jgi:DNA topoisomerase-1
LITYLRTDSVRISDEAKADAKAFITETYGEAYSDDTDIATKKSKKNIQDAHEAIRPANLRLVPSDIKDSLSRDQFRLYQLIWRRFMASQMSAAEYETTTVRVGAGNYVFSLATSKRTFDGFMSVYVSADDEEEEKNAITESLQEGSVLTLKEFQEKQHFTQPPAHFTEASLVHTLEELGIGRPSTYSPTITVLLKRRYIGKEGRSIFVTELGDVVNDIMKESFATIVDESFTANMESLLDGVEEGDVDWKSIVRNFYPDLEASVKTAEEQLQKVDIADEVTDVICENCGRNMVVKYGPHGKFLACPGFPDCRNTKPYLEKIGVACPKCGKDIVVRKTKKGRRFYGCEDYPDCDFMSWPRPVADKCPKCGGYMVQKGNRVVCADEQCGYIADSKA